MVKVKAFTILDTLIAITITAIIVGALSLSFDYIIDSEKPLLTYKFKAEVTKMHHELIEKKAYLNQTVTGDNYQISQIVEPYKGKTDLFLVSYSISIQSKVVYIEKHLISNDEE